MKFKRKKTAGSLRTLALWFLVFYLFTTLLPPALYRYVPAASPEGAEQSGSPEPAGSPEPSGTQEPSEASGPSEQPEPAGTPEPPGATPIPGPLDGEGGAYFTLYDTASGETLKVDTREFLISDLACEMDLHAPREALKAQVVAAYTYYSRMRESGGEIPCDTESWLVYAPEEKMRERWGEDYEEYRGILEEVVDGVWGQALTYKGELILASYFAISPGSTENVEDVWSEDADIEHPYLQAVASPGDMFSDGYLSYAVLTKGEIQEAFPKADLSGDPDSWLSDPQRTPSGTVKSVRVGGTEADGQEVRTALGLRSACFSWEPEGENLRFTVRGWGHGVGLSQAGAVFMAKRGAGYEEILRHYYPGTALRGG